MIDFENYAMQASKICMQIERNMIALGIDWRNESDLKTVAHGALGIESVAMEESDPRRKLLQHELYGMIELMTRTLEEAAQHDVEIHGSEMWKALMKTMWIAKDGDTQ